MTRQTRSPNAVARPVDDGVSTAEVDTPDASVDPAAFRQALSRFTSGVTVVTTVRPLPGRDAASDGDVHGMTANAFTSVSLLPPLVLVSVAMSATLDRRIAETSRYGVSILSAGQEPLSRHFAGAAEEFPQIQFVWRRGIPFLDGALVHLACTVQHSHPAGDHTLHIARVDGLWYRDGPPLVFYAGQFHSLDT